MADQQKETRPPGSAQNLTLKQRMLNRLGDLRTERSSFDSHWKSIGRVTAPRAARFFVTDRNRGERRNQEIYDETAVFDLRTLQSGLGAGITSPARPWVKLKIPDKKLMERSQAVKQHLYETESAVYDCLNGSNYYQSLSEVYLQGGDFATACMLILEDDQDDIRCHTLPIGSYYLGTDAAGRVNTVYREFSMTVGQLVKKYGYVNCSQQTRAAYDAGKIDGWVEVVHAIEPNDARDARMLDNQNMPIRSVRFEKSSPVDDDTFLSFTGFREFPAVAPRWEVTGEDVYGSSCPGMIALPAIQMLQRCVKLHDKILHKIADPPLLADVMLRNEITSLLPAGITYISGLANAAGAGVRPIHEIKAEVLQHLQAKIEELKQNIHRAFYADLMQMFATSDISNVTAREVEERHQEKLLVLGPVMERWDQELLDASLMRVIEILRRKGKIPPTPPEMKGQPFVFEYVSLMATALKMVGTASVDRMMSFVGSLTAVYPEASDMIDIDETIIEYHDMLGAPPKMIRSKDDVAKIRNQRAQAQQKQAQAEQMAQMAPAMQKGADAARLLSETGVGESTALNRLLGQ
jgi:hypothetical protein